MYARPLGVGRAYADAQPMLNDKHRTRGPEVRERHWGVFASCRRGAEWAEEKGGVKNGGGGNTPLNMRAYVRMSRAGSKCASVTRHHRVRSRDPF